MGKTTKQQNHQSWLRDNAWKATIALRLLHQAKKQKCIDFDDRIRAVRKFADQIYVRAADPQQTELFEASSILSPEIERLLEAPLRGIE